MRTLLHIQRVSRQSKATIDGSVKLQRALWFLPDPNIVADDLSQTVGNPILMYKLHRKFELSFSIEESLPIERLDVELDDWDLMKVTLSELSAAATPPRMGSWQRMLLTQPFDPDLPYSFAYNTSDKWWVVSREYAAAPTLGAIIDAVREWDGLIQAERRAGSLYDPTVWTDVWSPGKAMPRALP